MKEDPERLITLTLMAEEVRWLESAARRAASDTLVARKELMALAAKLRIALR